MRDPRQKTVVDLLLGHRQARPAASAEADAPANIALCKYWGKRDAGLNLPVTSSLSVSLGRLGTRTRIEPADGADDIVLLGPEDEPAPPAFATRVSGFLDLVRPEPTFRFRVRTHNRIPTGAGFASSASGFAALVRALDRLFGWGLEPERLSILARLGSGSACRSLFDGFVEWTAGTRPDGMDSHARRLPAEWPGLCVGLLPIETGAKSVGSRAGMEHTTATSPLYAAWPGTVERDLAALRKAIDRRDLALLGATAEGNALAMHATMLAARPPLLYWRPESVAALRRVWSLREEGLPLWVTMDAGPNLKLLFEAASLGAVHDAFPSLQVARPFNLPAGQAEKR